jgi:hypothetical protein
MRDEAFVKLSSLVLPGFLASESRKGPFPIWFGAAPGSQAL